MQSENLNDLMLQIPSPRHKSWQYLLNFKQVAAPGKVSPLYQYSVSWISLKNPPAAGRSILCSGGQSMSVLPGKRVSGTNGMVTDDVSTTTMACATGAIVQCMLWGYRPYNLKYTSQEQDSLMSACIQAKRAAYFGGTMSYTENGHTISMKDFRPIPNYKPVKNDYIAKVEAIWGSNKAICVNKDHRRIKPGRAFPPHWQKQVPECGFDSPPSTLKWEEGWFIITGPAEDPSSAPSQ